MQSAYGPAVIHLQSGLKILCEAQQHMQGHSTSILTTSAVPYVPIEMLEEMFMRLDLQVTQVRNSGWRSNIF
jgi:hypothetical protein